MAQGTARSQGQDLLHKGFTLVECCPNGGFASLDVSQLLVKPRNDTTLLCKRRDRDMEPFEVEAGDSPLPYGAGHVRFRCFPHASLQ